MAEGDTPPPFSPSNSLCRLSVFYSQTSGCAMTLTIYLAAGLHFPVYVYRRYRVSPGIVVPFYVSAMLRLRSLCDYGVRRVNPPFTSSRRNNGESCALNPQLTLISWDLNSFVALAIGHTASRHCDSLAPTAPLGHYSFVVSIYSQSCLLLLKIQHESTFMSCNPDHPRLLRIMVKQVNIGQQLVIFLCLHILKFRRIIFYFPSRIIEVFVLVRGADWKKPSCHYPTTCTVYCVLLLCCEGSRCSPQAPTPPLITRPSCEGQHPSEQEQMALGGSFPYLRRCSG